MELLFEQLFKQILWSKGEDYKDRILFLLEKYFFQRWAKWKIDHFTKYNSNCVNLCFLLKSDNQLRKKYRYIRMKKYQEVIFGKSSAR